MHQEEKGKGKQSASRCGGRSAIPYVDSNAARISFVLALVMTTLVAGSIPAFSTETHRQNTRPDTFSTPSPSSGQVLPVDSRLRQVGPSRSRAVGEETLRTGEEDKIAQDSIKRILAQRQGQEWDRERQKPGKQEQQEDRDMLDLLRDKKIEIQTQGAGIQGLTIRVRKLVPQPVTIRIPVGTYFVSKSSASQNMVTTTELKQTLMTDAWTSFVVSVACANRLRKIPGGSDTFGVQRSPNQQELAKVMPVLDKANVPFPVRQAAVWIVTDNAGFDDLGILRGSRTGRVINEYEAAKAMQICDEAGINVTRKKIWSDRRRIIQGLRDNSLKQWLEQKR